MKPMLLLLYIYDEDDGVEEIEIKRSRRKEIAPKCVSRFFIYIIFMFYILFAYLFVCQLQSKASKVRF